jgi:PAS domain S-box-containing protein
MLSLRKQAESLANERAGELPDNPELLPPEAARRALHELRVHQIELEMQNEELRRVQTELEESRARYFDLYDLAPVGYLTLDDKGIILEANLTAARLLGVPRGDLVKQPLSKFILPEDQDTHYRRRRLLLEKGAPQSWELRLLRKDSELFWARIEATTAQNADGASVWRAAVSDITENKRAERLIQAHSDELHEFAYALTHDVQEPLGTVLNLTQRLAQDYKGRLGETTDKYLAYCVESALRIEVLLKGLADYLDYRARRQSMSTD